MKMPRDYREQFADRVSTARRHGGFTQQEIADLLGVQIGTFAKYEKRANAPSPNAAALAGREFLSRLPRSN